MAELPYRIVIGLEVHVQLLTRTKLFCGCSTQFGLPPNSSTCPICIGMPGVLPVMNRKAFQLALRAALALNCQIARFTKWDRKNYYYPDLPKNYQISQYDLPFSHDGYLEIETEQGARRIGLIRAHLEEDAGKMLHDEAGTGKDSLVDLNRTGTPLLEIVSKPEISSPEEAKAYLEELRLLLREIGVSDCEMQEGSLRCDANINLHIPQSDGPVIKTPIVEIKNLNSFRAVERSLRYEAERHYKEALREPKWRIGVFAKETRGWDDARGATLAQRRKEEVADYRYFPEPDLVMVTVDDALLEKTRAEMGELPAALRLRLAQQYGLSNYDASVLTAQGRAVAAYFETTARLSGDAKAASNWVTNRVLASLNEKKIGIGDFSLAAETLADLIKKVQSIGLNMQRARDVYACMLEHSCGAQEAIDRLGIKPGPDRNALVEIVRQAMAANPKAVANFKEGKLKAADAIKGAVMKDTRGMAKMDLVQEILMEELRKA
jgi:aspartyl-tRNA(Asn)/glutamyl-tRNA(Gln) amidotransferase subunit B